MGKNAVSPPTETHQLGIRIPKALWRRAKLDATRNDETLMTWVADAMEQKLQRTKGKAA